GTYVDQLAGLRPAQFIEAERVDMVKSVHMDKAIPARFYSKRRPRSASEQTDPSIEQQLRQADVGGLETGHEQVQEGGIECMLAALGGVRQRLGPDLDHGDFAYRDYAGGALEPPAAQIRHFPEAFAGTQDIEQLLLLGHAHLSRGQNVERTADLRFADHETAGRILHPLRNAHHLPQVDIG